MIKLRKAFADGGVTFSESDGKECVCYQAKETSEMNYIGGFELDVSLGHEGSPASVRVVLRNVAQGPEGQVFITPECTSLDDVESYINAIQTDLDDMRNQAHRVFQKP